MENLNLGKLIEQPQQRDAIHIAVAPVTAGERLKPGQAVGFDKGSHERVNAAHNEPIGIVDPFLTAAVESGQRCWLFLYPNTITSLRHDWTHPAFPQEGRIHIPAGASKEEVRLREIAAAIGISYDEMMYGADEWVQTSKDSKWGGEYVVQHGHDSWRDNFPAFAAEFWNLYDVVRGVSVPAEHRESFFSCSC